MLASLPLHRHRSRQRTAPPRSRPRHTEAAPTGPVVGDDGGNRDGHRRGWGSADGCPCDADRSAGPIRIDANQRHRQVRGLASGRLPPAIQQRGLHHLEREFEWRAGQPAPAPSVTLSTAPPPPAPPPPPAAAKAFDAAAGQAGEPCRCPTSSRRTTSPTVSRRRRRRSPAAGWRRTCCGRFASPGKTGRTTLLTPCCTSSAVKGRCGSTAATRPCRPDICIDSARVVVLSAATRTKSVDRARDAGWRALPGVRPQVRRP